MLSSSASTLRLLQMDLGLGMKKIVTKLHAIVSLFLLLDMPFLVIRITIMASFPDSIETFQLLYLRYWYTVWQRANCSVAPCTKSFELEIRVDHVTKGERRVLWPQNINNLNNIRVWPDLLLYQVIMALSFGNGRRFGRDDS